MEALSLAFAALNFTGAVVAEQIAGEAVENIWSRVKEVARKRFGRDPAPTDLKPDSELAREFGPALLKSAESLLASDPTLRRVKLVATVFQGAKILWVDDAPRGNTFEAGFLRQLGCVIDQVFTSAEAAARLASETYDVVISDMDRAGDRRAGLQLLGGVTGDVPVIFYVLKLDPTKDRPIGSLGIVKRPDDLFHLVMDVLERTRA